VQRCRMRAHSPFVVFLIAAAIAVMSCAPPPKPKPFTVRDGFIRDVDGRAVIMRGVNISGQHKLPPFFDFHQAPDFAKVRDEWGMNGVRFLVSWGGLEPEPGKYDDAYVAKIAERMDWAAKAGLFVVIDFHQDLYGLGFPVGNGAPKWTCAQSHYDSFASTYQPTDQWFLAYLNPDIIACYDNFWSSDDLWTHYANAVAHLAKALHDKPAIIGVDLMNEPYWGSAEVDRFEPEDLEPFYERVIPAMRDQAPDWLVFAEPASSRNLGQPTHLTKLPFDDVVYAPHSYDGTAEQGQDFNASHVADVIDNANKLRGEANALQAALWIGEYGGMSKLPNIGAYMTAEYDAAATVAASTMYYDFTKNDGGYGLLNADGTEKPELLDIVVRPYPSRVAGTPKSYAFDAATKTFTLTMGAASRGTTEIIVPKRVYANGVDVDCGGCAHSLDAASQVLKLEDVKADSVVTVKPK
jgi:endoglycosylceramidase